jgi:hypothetical protein
MDDETNLKSAKKRTRASASQEETPLATSAQTIANWPRFLVVESTDSSRHLDKLSPFAIHKCIQCAAGNTKNIRKQRDGTLLLEVTDQRQSDSLLKLTVFIDITVKVSAHHYLNSCRGVVRSRDLRDCTEQEVKEGLADQGVTDVRRINAFRNGVKVPTNTLILTFARSTLPPTIKAGYLAIKMEPYIPNPLKCFKCQRYGHHQTKCTREQVCARCGTTGHGDTTCEENPHCINCSGSHTSYARECPTWAREKEIVRVKHTCGISFPEARKVVESRNPVLGVTFSDAVKGKPKSVTIGTQTEGPPMAPTQPSASPSKPSASPSKKQIPVSKTTSCTNTPTPKSQTTRSVEIRSPTLRPGPLPVQTPIPATLQLKASGTVAAKDTSRKLVLSNRNSKGSNDPIKVYNKYGSLEEMDTGGQEPPPNPKEPGTKKS